MFDGRSSIGTDDGTVDLAETSVAWREADAQLRRIARRRAGLDAGEARWLLAARRAGTHRQLGFATMLEYIERTLGHGPRAAAERLRVAEALESLPAMRDALAAGDCRSRRSES